MRAPALTLAFAWALLFGCGDDSPTPGDASFPDAPTTGPMLPNCEMPLTGSSMVGETLSLSLDTSEGAPGGLDLAGCGGSGAAPQVVIEYRVPGTGPMKVVLDTQVPGTSTETDTVIDVREVACDVPIIRNYPPRCFDDFMGDFRAKGALSAMGGDVVWLVVTTFTAEDAGPIQLDITATENTAPTLDEAFVRLVGESIEVEVTGGDVDGNADGVWVSLLDSTRGLVDVDDDDVADQADVLIEFLDNPVTGATRFTEIATIDVTNVTGASNAMVRLLDDGHAMSEPLRVPVETGTRVGFGEMCDGMMTVCARELVCTSGTCQATPARAAACAAAPTITLTAATPTGSQMGVLMPGTGSFRGTCGATTGTELFYHVEVPDLGNWDLILTTEAPGTPSGADTVLYVRDECTDPDSGLEEWCNDDFTGLLSYVEVLDASGTYTAFVEDYAGVEAGTSTRFELAASLRPVVGSGEACDPELVLNRCSTGECPADTMVCP